MADRAETRVRRKFIQMHSKHRKLSVLSFPKKLCDWWHFSIYDEEHCFAWCPCGNSFPVTWCTSPLHPSCSCLSEQGVSRSFDRKRLIPCPPSSPDSTSLDFFYWGVVKDNVCLKKLQNVNELRDRFVSAVERVTNETLASTDQNVSISLIPFVVEYIFNFIYI